MFINRGVKNNVFTVSVVTMPAGNSFANTVGKSVIRGRCDGGKLLGVLQMFQKNLKSIHRHVHYKLVGALEPWNFMTFPSMGTIIPTDFHSIIFQRGRAKNHQPVNLIFKPQNFIPIPSGYLT